MRRVLVGTGWKMNFLLAEAEAYLAQLCAHLRTSPPGAVEVFVVAPFTLLRAVRERTRGSPVRVGAQNVHFEESGAFTGEISPPMVADCGVDLVELGHSERRALFGETDLTVNHKVRAALAHRLTPLVCVGESREEKEMGVAEESVVRQVKMALHGVSAEQAPEVLIAYEPVWAIGKGGTPAEPSYASRIHAAIRSGLEDRYGAALAARAPILYGGSVNLANAGPLLSAPDIDGLFVGRVAWRAEGLIALVEIAKEWVQRRARGPAQ